MLKGFPFFGQRWPPIHVAVSPARPLFDGSKSYTSYPSFEDISPRKVQEQSQFTLIVPWTLTTCRPMIAASAPAVWAPSEKLTGIVCAEQVPPTIALSIPRTRSDVSPQLIELKFVLHGVPVPEQ